MARRIHFWCFLTVVLLAPLPLGSNRPAFWSLLAALMGALCLLWPFVADQDRHRLPEPLMRLAVPLALFGVAAGWGFLQATTGLPEEWAHPVWSLAAAQLQDAGPRVAADAGAASDGAMRLLAYGATLFLAVQHGRSSRRAALAIDGLALVGGAYALYGLALLVVGSQTILGMPKWAYADSLTSTFVNRNSYAAYAGLGLLCALVACWRRLEPTKPPLSRLLLHIARPTMLFVAAAVLIFLAVPATESRAGTAVTVLGTAMLAGAGWCAGRTRGKLMMSMALCLVPLIAGVGLAWVLVLSEVGNAMASDRLAVYRITLGFIEDRPLLGHGLGSFATVFRLARPVGTSLPWTEAHNSYLELASDLGLPAAAALLAAVGWLVAICFHALLRARSEHATSALAVAATLLLGVHAVVDFSPQIPAVTVTWLTILGIGVARAWRALDAGPQGAARSHVADRAED